MRITTLNLIALLLAGLLFATGCKDKNKAAAEPTTVAATTPTPAATPWQYKVVKGDNLIEVAEKTGVPAKEIGAWNHAYLQAWFNKNCKGLRRPWFCNKRRTDQPLHTLQIDMILQLPPGTATTVQQTPTSAGAISEGQIAQTAQEIISQIEGDKVALVIDDTGSMSTNRERTAQLFDEATAQYGKKITGIFLYSGKQVTKYSPDQKPRYLRNGTRENSYQALIEALNDSAQPTTLVLITDEEGDDWPEGTITLPRAVSVIAVCLPSSVNNPCTESLPKLVRDLGDKSRYVEVRADAPAILPQPATPK